LLNTEDVMPPEARAVLRTKLNLGAEPKPTNAVPESVVAPTNAAPAPVVNPN
jgi:hypothetical protein